MPPIPKTRDRILDLLRKNPTISPPSISRELGLSKALVHFHLRNLLNENVIRRVETPTTWTVLV